MRKFLLFVLFSAAVLLLSPESASANQAADEGTLRHAYKPVIVENTKNMRARLDNFTSAPVSRLVCVEAFNTVSNMKTHIGCLKVSADMMNSTMGDWAFEFNAPLDQLTKGSYKVVYTYQGTDGMWHHIKSINMQVWDGMYTAV